MNKLPHFTWILLACVTAALSKPRSASAPRYHWWPYAVDTANKAGLGTAVRVDSKSGKIHIAYRQNESIKYAVGEPGNFQISMVADTFYGYGARPEMALDKDGNPHILYSNYDCTRLTLASLKDGKWVRCAIDTAVDENECYKFSIEYGPDECLHIFYAANRMIDGEQIQRPAYTKVCDGQCAGGVELYKKHGGKWDALAFDKSGKPAAAWFTHDTYDLEFGVKAGDDPWQLERILDSGWASAGGIAIAMKYGSDEKFYIAHNDFNRKQFYLATGNPGDWKEEAIDTILPATDNSGQPAFILDVKPFAVTNPMVLDSGKHPLIARYDWTKQDLQLLYKNGASWTREIIDSAGMVGMHASMELDKEGRPVVTYYNESRTALFLAVGMDSAPPDTNNNGIPDYQEATKTRPLSPKRRLKRGPGKVKVFNLRGDHLYTFDATGSDWQADFRRWRASSGRSLSVGNNLLVVEFQGADKQVHRSLSASLTD